MWRWTVYHWHWHEGPFICTFKSEWQNRHNYRLVNVLIYDINAVIIGRAQLFSSETVRRLQNVHGHVTTKVQTRPVQALRAMMDIISFKGANSRTSYFHLPVTVYFLLCFLLLFYFCLSVCSFFFPLFFKWTKVWNLKMKISFICFLSKAFGHLVTCLAICRWVHFPSSFLYDRYCLINREERTVD